MEDLTKKIIELTQPADISMLQDAIREKNIRKLVINYQYDSSPNEADYFNRINEDGSVSDCEDPVIVPFSSPFSGMKLSAIDFPVEIGPKCTSLRGLFADQKKLKRIYTITGTDHVTNFNYLFSDCFHLTKVPRINLAKAKSCVGMFSGCHRIENIEVTGGDNVENCSGMFEYCYQLQKGPEILFPNCKIASSLFDSCFNLKKVPVYFLPEVRDCACMFQDCIRLRNVPNIHIPQNINFIQMFANCRSLLNVPTFIYTIGRNNSTALLLCCFDGCESIEKPDIRFLLRNCPDSLLSWHDAVLNNEDMKKAISNLRKNRKHENHHWLSNIIIFTVLLFTTAFLSMKYWHSSTPTDDKPAKDNAESSSADNGVISKREAKINAAIKDVREIIENYTTRCPTRHITFESYTDDILLKSVNQIGLYQSKLYKLGNETGEPKYILIIANKNASYVSEPLQFEQGKHKLALMKQIDLQNADTSMLNNPVSAEEFSGLTDKISSIQPVLNDTDIFILGSDYNYTLAHFKYKKIPVDLSDKIFYQYAIPVLLKETDTGRYLVPMPREGHYYYLDQYNQISDERLAGCFEIPQSIYDGMDHGLTYRQAAGLSVD